jgi:hypothetical protein
MNQKDFIIHAHEHEINFMPPLVKDHILKLRFQYREKSMTDQETKQQSTAGFY